MFDIKNSPFGTLVWFTGTIESILDPKGLDRVQVRCFGFHSDNRAAVATTDLPWAPLMHTGARMSAGLMLPGNLVVGFFLDGNEAQQPVVMGVLTGVPTTKNTQLGFSDPTGKYPKAVNTPDNYPSARGVANGSPTTYTKSTVLSGIPAADGGSFSEPPSAFAPVYPQNHVLETTEGHIFELDDTPGAERIHMFHKAGSFYEFHPDGTLVVRSIKDEYELILGNKNMYVAGALNITVAGDVNIASGGKITMSSVGDVNWIVGCDFSLQVVGKCDVNATGDVGISTTGSLDLSASGTINQSSSGSMDLSSSGSISIQAPSSISVQASTVEIGSTSVSGSGGGGSGGTGASGTPVAVPVKKIAPPTAT